MFKDVTYTLVAHPCEDGKRVRVTGLGPRPFDVFPTNTLLAQLGSAASTHRLKGSCAAFSLSSRTSPHAG